MKRAQMKKQAIRAARAQGCTCDVEIRFGSPEHPFHGTEAEKYGVSVMHDDWCPLLRVMEERKPGLARTQLVISREEDDAA